MPLLLQWLFKAKVEFRFHFESFYPPVNIEPDRFGDQRHCGRGRGEETDFCRFIARGRASREADELDRYFHLLQIEDIDLDLMWWWKDERQRFPRLSRMAFDILSIPAMAVEPERTFSF